MARSKTTKKTSGRRAGYAPAVTEIGGRKYLPIGWANWLGFVMFGLITVALLAEFFTSIAESRGADPVAAGVMTIVFGVMTYLFGTTRVKD